jgi:hypothetical protein
MRAGCIAGLARAHRGTDNRPAPARTNSKNAFATDSDRATFVVRSDAMDDQSAAGDCAYGRRPIFIPLETLLVFLLVLAESTC